MSTKDNAPNPINVGTESRTGAEGSTGSGKHTTSAFVDDTRSVRIADLKIADGYRKDDGDLDGLGDSMSRLGILQSIVVDEQNNVLCGRRRVKAAKRLGWTTIPARVVNVVSAIEAEYDENVQRKDFTESEKVAIADALMKEMGDRRTRGHPHHGADTNGEETREIAAKKAGFESRESYRKAKIVVDEGAPELVDAVDQGEASVSAAAQVAKLPKDEQRKIVKAGTVKETAASIRKGEKPVKVAKPDVPKAEKAMVRGISKFASAAEDCDPEAFAARFVANPEQWTLERVRRVREWSSRFLDKVSRITTDTDDIYESENEQMREELRSLRSDNEGLMADSARLAELTKIIDENEPLKAAVSEIAALKDELKLMTESRNRQQENSNEAIRQRDDKDKHIAVLKKNIAKLEKQIKA